MILSGTRYGSPEAAGIHNISFVQGDVGNLPFEDKSFDIVLSLNGFYVKGECSRTEMRFPPAPPFRWPFNDGHFFLYVGVEGCFYNKGTSLTS